ncbi:MAG: ATP-binding protein [Amphiplicatus sp.]
MSARPQSSLRFQMATVLVLGLLLSNAIGFLLYTNDRRDAVSTTEAFSVAERAAGVIILLRNLPDAWRGDVITASDTRAFRVWSTPRPTLAVKALSNDEEEVLSYLRALTPRLASREMRLAITPALPADVAPPNRVELPGAPAGGAVETAAELVTISVDHPDGYWLNFVGAIPRPAAIWPSLLGGYLVSIVVGVAIIAFWLVHRATQPLEDFARAAERLGKDIGSEPLNEQAPNEVAKAAHAFNLMQERIARLVRNRTELLAAISHDLRTPITQLKLRSETLENAEERGKFIAALEEMELITATFLDYARSAFGNEERSRIELGSLVESLCSDMADGGADVVFEEGTAIECDCKRLALKRGVRNLIENAVKHGGTARVAALRQGGEIAIRIDDDGPGIPESELEDAFAPFWRGDPSRSRRTGGVGLGLSIAQAVAHDHGGRIVLTNREKGGLRAELFLPA